MMSDMRHTVLVPLLCLAPCIVSAQVTITEFMYDAPGTDDKQEWVEIYNGGSTAVDLTKWKINDGSNHVLNVPPKNGGVGSITIQPGGYAILASDAPTFVTAYPNVANVIDTTLSLSNTSGTIQLIDDAGAVADTVTYAKAQGAAGDGNTLQWNGSTYVPGTSSPGVAFDPSMAAAETSDSTSGSTDTTSGTQTQTSTQSSQTTAVSSYVAPPTPSIYAYAGKDRDVIAGADVIFQGAAYNKKGDAIGPQDKVRFLWTFGDGGSAEGPAVTHRFAQPGRYAVVLDLAQAMDAASAQIVITAHPVSIDVSVDNGSIILANRSGRDLDLSGWFLQSGTARAQLPPHTILLKGATIPFSPETTRLAAGVDAQLLYPNSIVAAHTGESAEEPVVTAAADVSTPPIVHIATAPVEIAVETVQPETETVAIEDVASVDVSASTSSAQVASVAESVPGSSTWWYGAGALALLGGAATAAARRGRRTTPTDSADGWEIEDVSEKE